MSGQDKSESSDLGMPKGPRPDMIPTLNNMGFMFQWVDTFGEEFIKLAGSLDEEVLEIGCAYGVVTLPTLANGARVCACDMEPQHLEILKSRVPDKDRARLRTVAATLPNAELPDEAFAAIFSSRVIHFLRGPDIEASVANMYRWLRPGGTLILVADTPYTGIWKGFAPTYEANKAAGDQWPGLIEDCAKYVPKRSPNSVLPPFMNFLDPDVLTRICQDAGFTVRRAGFVDRPDLNDDYGSGKDQAGIVAVKP